MNILGGLNRGWSGRLFKDLDVILRADDASDADRFASGYGSSRLGARWRGVARSSLDVGNLTNAVGRYGCEDGCSLANE